MVLLFLSRETIANRDSSITERDTNIMNLRRQTEAATDDLKVRQKISRKGIRVLNREASITEKIKWFI
jgi:hypothetical protein